MFSCLHQSFFECECIYHKYFSIKAKTSLLKVCAFDKLCFGNFNLTCSDKGVDEHCCFLKLKLLFKQCKLESKVLFLCCHLSWFQVGVQLLAIVCNHSVECMTSDYNALLLLVGEVLSKKNENSLDASSYAVQIFNSLIPFLGDDHTVISFLIMFLTFLSLWHRVSDIVLRIFKNNFLSIVSIALHLFQQIRSVAKIICVDPPRSYLLKCIPAKGDTVCWAPPNLVGWVRFPFGSYRRFKKRYFNEMDATDHSWLGPFFMT